VTARRPVTPSKNKKEWIVMPGLFYKQANLAGLRDVRRRKTDISGPMMWAMANGLPVLLECFGDRTIPMETWRPALHFANAVVFIFVLARETNKFHSRHTELDEPFMHTHNRSNLLSFFLFLAYGALARADFEPIDLTADSYNEDVIVENTAPPPLVPVTTASMEEGTANSEFTWYERGYVTESPVTGIPEAGTILMSDQSPDYRFQMPFSYKTNNAILIDPVRTNGLLTFTLPASYSAVSFLTSSGRARNQIGYTLHHADNSKESGTFSSPNWYNDGNPACAGNGRVNVTTFVHADLDSYNPRLYSVDIGVANRVSPITSIELWLASGRGHTAILAVSGSVTLGEPFAPIAISGYNEDLIVEASATRPGFLSTNTTATMDNGIVNERFTWYERGYYPPAGQSGLPAAGCPAHE
jgi:hypothetical protein